MSEDETSLASAPRWSGAAGRTEVWYATLTEPQTGTGLWVHYETVSPTAGCGEPYGHGWVALFPPDDPPACERFGPSPITQGNADRQREGAQREGAQWFDDCGASAVPGRLSGSTATVSWDLRWQDPTPPLWTFPRLAWERELLPAAQVVPAPSARFDGKVECEGKPYSFDGARGGVAHIYGHGNAKRWGWIHADLGRGDVLELVSAVSMRPGMNKLPPLAFIRLRVGGRDWPGGLLPSMRVRSNLALPRWSVEGRIGWRRIRIDVDQPAERCVALEYADPDGERAVCTNTERADIDIEIQRWELGGRGGRWVRERSWSLRGTGHAEVGLRSPDAPPPSHSWSSYDAGVPAPERSTR